MNGVANISLAAQSRTGKIAFIDLQAQQRRIRDGVEMRLKKVLDHGRYIAGPEIDELEECLAIRTGAAKVVTCASGTAALIIPLLALGIEPGDAVFIPAFTYNATANAVILSGAEPVFVDVDHTTFNMDPQDLRTKIDQVKATGRLRPRAIIPVDLFGSPADYDAIGAIATEEAMTVVADGAQSFGGKLHNRTVGNLAPITATSFFPGKSLGAYGDAGAIFAQKDAPADVWESIRWHGTDAARKDSIRVGFNGRMDSMQAAILLEKLDIFDDELEARKRIADRYNERLGEVVRTQRYVDGAESGHGYYSVCTSNRDDVVKRVNEAGVPTAIYYTKSLHKMNAFSAFAEDITLPKADKLCGEIFALPMHPYLTPDQVDYICDVVEAAVRETGE